jgi:hypothetical protein
MYAGIRASGAVHLAYGRFENLRACAQQFALYRAHIALLHLPAVVTRTVVFDDQFESHKEKRKMMPFPMLSLPKVKKKSGSGGQKKSRRAVYLGGSWAF